MRLEDQIGQMFAVGFDGLTAPAYLLEWLAEGRVGGVILFARNIESPAQVAALTESLHKAAKHPLIIGIDQEGGTVARLREGFSESPGAMALGCATEEPATRVGRVERVFRVLAQELRGLGINWNYAPVVDISYNAENPSVGTRSFGANQGWVGALASGAVLGLQENGVAACAKHFPGLGNTAIDTHVALPTLDTSVEALMAHDLVPYQAVLAVGIDSIMTTHTIFRALDAKHPATLSPVVVPQLLRETLGFEGVVTTDCMEMHAITKHYGAGESAVLAALASVDMILVSHTPAKQREAYAALLDAVQSGRVGQHVIEQANARIAALKRKYAFTGVDTSGIRSAAHLAVMQEAARAGLTLLKGTLPLDTARRLVVIEFASVLESGIVESGGQTGLARLIQARDSHIQTLALRSLDDGIGAALRLIAQGDTLILATRNAHLIPQQREKALKLARASQQVIHIALRNPYDAALLPEAETTLCSCGDSEPSLEAVVAALFGDFTPTGVLPVPLETV